MENRTLKPTELLSLSADVLGIFGFVFFIKNQIDGAISNLRLPQQLDFYFLFFWAFVAAILGGFVWNIFVRLTKQWAFLGGKYEPHGLTAILWPIVTNIPVAIVLISLNIAYLFIEFRTQVLLYSVFLLGLTMGAKIFYDTPIKGSRGFRNHFEAKKMPFFWKEFWLVLIWSALLSLGFLLSNGIILLTTQRDLWEVFINFLKQTGLCIGLTSLAVIFFLLAFPEQPRMETARGIVAGLFLRIALFFGLLFI